MLKTLQFNSFSQDQTVPDDSITYRIKMSDTDVVNDIASKLRRTDTEIANTAKHNSISSINDPTSLFNVDSVNVNSSNGNISVKDKSNIYDVNNSRCREFDVFRDYFGLIDLIVKKEKSQTMNKVNAFYQQQHESSLLSSGLDAANLWSSSDTPFSVNLNGSSGNYFGYDSFNSSNGLNRSDPHRSRFDSLESEMSSLTSSSNGTPTMNNENDLQHFSFAESRSLPKITMQNGSNPFIYPSPFIGDVPIGKEVSLTNGSYSASIRRNNKQRTNSRQVCVFCRNNGEHENVYTKHQLKDADGKITCPILRAYTCPICGATGENSHTIKYCPSNTESNNTNGNTPISTMGDSIAVSNENGYSTTISNSSGSLFNGQISMNASNTDIKKMSVIRARQPKYGIH